MIATVALLTEMENWTHPLFVSGFCYCDWFYGHGTRFLPNVYQALSMSGFTDGGDGEG